MHDYLCASLSEARRDGLSDAAPRAGCQGHLPRVIQQGASAGHGAGLVHYFPSPAFATLQSRYFAAPTRSFLVKNSRH